MKTIKTFEQFVNESGGLATPKIRFYILEIKKKLDEIKSNPDLDEKTISKIDKIYKYLSQINYKKPVHKEIDSIINIMDNIKNNFSSKDFKKIETVYDYVVVNKQVEDL